jgi:hypothetical protein
MGAPGSDSGDIYEEMSLTLLLLHYASRLRTQQKDVNLEIGVVYKFQSSVLAQGSGDNGSFHNLGCTLYGIE